MKINKLRRIEDGNEFIGGICAGLAYCLKIPTWVLRVLASMFLIFPHQITVLSIILFLYLMLWLFLPAWDKTPEDYKKICE